MLMRGAGAAIPLLKRHRCLSTKCSIRKRPARLHLGQWTYSTSSLSIRSAKMIRFGSLADIFIADIFSCCTAHVGFWGVKRTWVDALQMSAFDPKRTYSQRHFPIYSAVMGPSGNFSCFASGLQFPPSAARSIIHQLRVRWNARWRRDKTSETRRALTVRQRWDQRQRALRLEF
jgi:hypothetical protein